MLDALTANPDVWAKTALLLTYDENDGFFDHVVPAPTRTWRPPGPVDGGARQRILRRHPGHAPAARPARRGPYGLGSRVPMLVVSPWSTGGWVCSETFDHTSLIRFMEKRFGVHEPNITPWRRAVCGDLTSAFDFTRTSDAVPTLPSVNGFAPSEQQIDDKVVPPSYHPVPPATGAVPVQEPGVKPSRRLGYRLDVDLAAGPRGIQVAMRNRGELGAGLQARSLSVVGGPWTYTVAAGDSLIAELPHLGAYDLSVHGPNGFFRHIAGSPQTTLGVKTAGHPENGTIAIHLSGGDQSRRRGRGPTVTVTDAYGASRTIELEGVREISVATAHVGGWYDLAISSPDDPSFAFQLAGRLETHGPLTSDPQLGRA